MNRQTIIDEVRFRVTGGVLDLELDDSALNKAIDAAFREIQRYIDTSKFIMLPYSRCIDLGDAKITAVVAVYRTESFAGSDDKTGTGLMDPMYVAQWQLLSGIGNLANITDYIANYAAWNTSLQIRNTTSTDLSFIYDRDQNKLYINTASNLPTNVTIEFIPEYHDVSELHSPYWEDILIRLTVAIVKVTLGRIRSRYTQSGALWVQDGERMLDEGNSELADLREKLSTNSQLAFPMD